MKTTLLYLVGLLFGPGVSAHFVGEGAAPKVVARVVASADNPAPGVWIGVRVTALPEALASHLGRSGLMVANLVKDGPADLAGLDRFDVVVSFDGAPIEDMAALTGAIQRVGAGREAQMVVIQKGQERTVRIAPAARPNAGAWEFRYEEPEDEQADTFTRYFGHRLDQDPSGNWTFQPLGRLDDLPDNMKDWLGRIDNLKLKDLADLDAHVRRAPPGVRIEIDADSPGAFGFSTDADNGLLEFRVKVDENGETLTIERGPDGLIHVERVQADGSKSSASYEDAEQLENEDPGAYAVFRRFSIGAATPMLKLPDGPKDLRDMQWRFQSQVQDAVAKARQAMKDAGSVSRSVRKNFSSAGDAHSESVSITVDNGRVSISISKDGDTTEYEFDSLDEFRKQEPELYERYRDTLGDSPDGASLGSGFASACS